MSVAALIPICLFAVNASGAEAIFVPKTDFPSSALIAAPVAITSAKKPMLNFVMLPMPVSSREWPCKPRNPGRCMS